MKGLVFTELLAMAENAIGEDAVDDMLDRLTLASDGAYSAVGNYPCSELVQIVGAVSDHTGLSGEALQKMFGAWMFDRFVQGYPQFFDGKSNALEMLDAIENEVHVEVRKLYPDAELPRFDTEWLTGDKMRMTYRSERPLVAFCHGLIEACVAHFEQDGTVFKLPDATANKAAFEISLTAA
ncbi:MAG: heme NO-binding domain-containing protein [Pelagimonas sp.]|jgi:hypothetical protein|nr:heme NO-binding domain-containing protein [Pelagimonas sp.]